MKKVEHTPGEWFYEHDTDGDFAIFGGEKGNKLIAVTTSDAPEDEANATLYVAGPDMLAALKLCREIMVNYGWPKSSAGREREVLEDTEAAIAKAEKAKAEFGGQVDCLECGKPIPYTVGTCPHCGRKEF